MTRFARIAAAIADGLLPFGAALAMPALVYLDPGDAAIALAVLLVWLEMRRQRRLP